MAEEHLTFKIGSTFSGEGFQKAQMAVKQVNGEVKNAVRDAGMIAAAFGQMDTSASKCMKAFTSLVGACATFNMATIATTAAMVAIDIALGDMRKKVEDARKAMDELKAATSGAFSKTLTEEMTKIRGEAEKISDDFERITNQANKLAAAFEGVRGAEARGGVINLEVEKLNKLLEAHSEEERANVEAAYNLKIAVQKSVDTEIEWKAKMESAHQAVVDGENRVANIDQKIFKIAKGRASLEETMQMLKESESERWRDVQREVNKLLEEEAALERKKQAVESETEVLRIQEQKVKQEAVNAQQQATLAIRNAELADKKLNEAKHAREVKETVAKESAELAATTVKTGAEIQADVNKAAQDLAAAQREYESALRAYNRNINRNIFNEQGRDRSSEAASSRQARAVEVAVRQGLEDGTIRNSRQQHEVEMAAARAQRDYESSAEANQIRRDDARYQRLKDMNPRAMSKADKKWMQQEEERREARDQDRKNLEAAENKKKEAELFTKWMQQDISEIRKKLDRLGLK